jgi:hypothetical protein
MIYKVDSLFKECANCLGTGCDRCFQPLFGFPDSLRLVASKVHLIPLALGDGYKEVRCTAVSLHFVT